MQLYHVQEVIPVEIRGTHAGKVEARLCGFPGRPRNGTSSTAAPVSRPGDTVHYTCRPGYTMFGEEERVCLKSGIWAGRQPLCELNLARDRAALISSTLWNYRASLAVDGNVDTCSFTPRTTEQRWWQVDLGTDHHVGKVSVIINKDSYQEFTIFIIQLLSKSEALYKPCSTFKGRFQYPRILFICNEGSGHQGRYVYIRDDRRDQDYFGLCEVEVFAYRDESICGEPEEPVAGHVVVGLDGTAIYSCETGYRLLAEPNRTCERDGHWTGHAPQCEEISCDPPSKTMFGTVDIPDWGTRFPFKSRVTYRCDDGYIIWGNATRVCTVFGVWSGETPLCKPITCGYPQTFPNSNVQLLNQSTLWNTIAVYTCRAGYSFTPGVVDVSITCQSTGSWEKINITCLPDDDRNLPVKLTGKEWGQQSKRPDNDSSNFALGTLGIILIGVAVILIILIISLLSVFLARKFKSKKKTRATPQSSTNDLIITNAKDGPYDDAAAVGFKSVPVPSIQTPHSPHPVAIGVEPSPNNMLPYFTRPQEPTCYDTLQSYPSVSSYNSTVITDVEQDPNYARIKRGDADGEGVQACLQELPRRPNSSYETVHLRTDHERPVSIPEYETVRNLQQMAADSTYEIVQPNGSVGSLNKSKTKRRSIPSALRMFLHPSSKPTESEMCDGAVPAEIMALYAQVDKTKKRKYRCDGPNTADGNHVIRNHVSSQTEEECECTQHPISDIVRFSQESCSPGMWNGNSKDCPVSAIRDCRVASPSGRPLPSVPSIRFVHTSQEGEPQNQTLECAQL